MIARMMSLLVAPGGQLAVDRDRHRLERRERQRLRGEHVLDLAGADAERERAERAVRRGVRVAADDRQARLGEAELRSDLVDDALVGVAERVDAHAELRGVVAQRLDLRAAGLVGDRPVDVERGGVVVLGRQGEVRAAHRATCETQALERLRARHLVHEVEVDVEEVGRPVGAPSHDVRVPDLLRQRAGHLLGPFSRSICRPGEWFSRLVCRRTCISAFETPISTYGQL